MGEVFHALEVLNRTMKLGLTGQQLLRAEMGFKSAFAQVSNPNPEFADPVALAEGYEIKATLQKRAQPKSLGELSTLARKSVTTPHVRVDPKAMKQIDKALTVAAAAKAPRKAAAKKAGA